MRADFRPAKRGFQTWIHNDLLKASIREPSVRASDDHKNPLASICWSDALPLVSKPCQNIIYIYTIQKNSNYLFAT